MWFSTTKYLQLFPYYKIVCLIMKSFSLKLPYLGSPKSHDHHSKPTRIQNSNLKCSMIKFLS